ncbi:MAG: SAM-dependent methyltransferase [Bacillaceae bacterium]|nr:SAM-dependent methyltransferase [Bacillaceae bacterium]
MKNLSFFYQYLVNPRDIGAILPSSRFLADKMIERINFHQAKFIVEYGPGTGIFTERLLKNRNPKTIILLVENNINFYNKLNEEFYKEKNLYIVNGSAENIDQYLKVYNLPFADYVISGLPFTSLPKEVSYNILLTTRGITHS